MSDLYTIQDYEKYRLFLPPASYTREQAEERHRQVCEENRSAIAGKPLPVTPEKAITGSFIYAHPPNYHGLPTLEFTKKDWLRELGRLRRYGMDTVIFQASLWSELKECYYPSRYFSDFRRWNVLEPMMEAAGELGMTLFLGGYGSVTCWRQHLDAGDVDEEFQCQWNCYQELLQRYRHHFAGVYFSPESAYSGTRNENLEEMLGRLYGKLFNSVHDADSELKILMSPATFYYSGNDQMQQMAEAWCAMFASAQPDILAPQDSIGCGCITLPHQMEGLRSWQEICRRCGIHLWSNVEVFDSCPPYVDDCSRIPATPERVAQQIENAAQVAEKLITWEALYYFSGACPQGRPLAQFLFGENA